MPDSGDIQTLAPAIVPERAAAAWRYADRLAVRARIMSGRLDSRVLPAAFRVASTQVRAVPAAPPGSMPGWADPWRTAGEQVGEQSIALRMLDGRQLRLVRRVRPATGGATVLTLAVAAADAPDQLRPVPLEMLPLYGSHDLPGNQQLVVVCEGIPATDVLRAAGVAAVGTLTGPDVPPSWDALRQLRSQAAVVLWPHGDTWSRRHLADLSLRLLLLGVETRMMAASAAGPIEAAAALQHDEIGQLLATAQPAGWTALPRGASTPSPIPPVPGGRLSLPEKERPAEGRRRAAP